ncbi:hypothetical protein CVS27_04435 [Arthrobacter glacialis]|uniref:DUF8094 domain-containing protein n=1 Tax=Arthrobacter glacialis TaxID=1664 RepID=A0A2S3ZZF2_ARTGL|nr:hypothetical protein CVS27_04435 [Arthrobacter glacialis]
MLGKYVRSKIAIVLAILGLLVLGSGIGQRTIWLPAAQLTATTPADVSAAPLTVISPEILKTRDGHFTLTVKSDGPIQLAVARERDIIGWIGDAAYTQVDGANDDFTALSTQSNAGAASVPNPAGSDLWVSEEKATGELTYTWQAPGHGDWALLLSSDGKAAAPTNISMTVDNQAGTPWAVPLMILGSAMLAAAALLFLIAPRKPKSGEPAPVGRRAAGKAPADPATGALEVDKLVAAREAAKSAAATGKDAPSTIAEARNAERPVAGAKAGGEASAPAFVSDATSALPAVLQPPAAQDPEAGSAAGAKSNDKNDDDSTKGSGGGDDDGKGASTPENDADVKGADVTEAKTEAKNDAKKKGKADFSASSPTEVATPRTMHKTMNHKSRWGAALAVILVAGSVGPAVAEDATTGAATPAPTSSASSTAPAASADANTPGFPSLLDSQVQRIATAVATVVASGDNAKNAKELESRVTGMALEVRTANYKIRSQVASAPAPEPVSATQLLAKVVTTTDTWPRSAMFVTKGENNELPQLLTLVQQSPRENYKLIKSTPLLPGQTFPTVDKEGTKEVAIDESAGLKMSPKDAIAALSDRLTKDDSKFKDSFNDSVYITSVLDAQKKIVADAKDATNVFSHTADTKSPVAMRTADGGAMVVVGYTFGIDTTSKEDATLTVPADAAVFTGGTETTKGFTLSYAEPVVMYIPAASGDGKITLLSATRDLVGGQFK